MFVEPKRIPKVYNIDSQAKNTYIKNNFDDALKIVAWLLSLMRNSVVHAWPIPNGC